MGNKFQLTWTRLMLIEIAVSAVFLSCLSPAGAQQTEINSLIAPLAKEISRSHKHKIVVLPLLSNDPQNSPLGIWLANQISAHLSLAVTGLDSVDTSDAQVVLRSGTSDHYPVYDPNASEEFAKKTGAEIIVTGNFAPFGNELGISLMASKRGDRRVLAENNGQIPLTQEMRALIPQSLRFEAPMDGIYRAGWGGVGVPKCKSCPDPIFPPDEKSRRSEGIVVLDAVIGIDGRAHEIRVEKGTSQSFEGAAMEAIMRWKFQPATGPDRKPVAASIPIEVKFR